VARLSSADRRAALVQAALRVIDRDGVYGATTRAIVAEASMSLASFHYAFRSRDEMIRELFAFVVKREEEASLAALTQTASIREAVRSGLQAYFDLLAAHPEREQALQELIQYSLRIPELAELPGAQYRSYFRSAQKMLEHGATLAGVRWAIPIEQLSIVLIAFTDGLTMSWLADRDDSAAVTLMDFAADAIAAQAIPAQAVPASNPREEPPQ
jgi:AcrR family transcriptional regulator